MKPLPLLPRLLALASFFVAGLGFVSAQESGAAGSAATPAIRPGADGMVEVTFTYRPTRREAQTVKDVTVAGEFNGWDAFATPMTKQEDGTWAVTVPLKKGKGQWKFLVNGNWIQNMETVAERIGPKPDRFVSDPYGGKNCENDF
jgi:hypothetical protein